MSKHSVYFSQDRSNIRPFSPYFEIRLVSAVFL